MDFLGKHATDEKKRKAAEDAKTTAEATEATRKANEQALEAKKVENEQKRKLEADAKAAKKAEVERKKKEDEEAKAAKEAEAVSANLPKDGSTRDRTRSPVPKGSESAASSTDQRPKNVTEALAKRPSDRSDAETLLAASDAKASRKSKEVWADAEDEMQDDARA